MGSKVKREIIAELRAHILDSAEELGDVNEANAIQILEKMDSPKKIAHDYKKIYGYATSFKILFIIIAGAIASLTLPIVPEVQNLDIIAAFFLPVLIIYLVVISLKAGKMVGLACGVVSMISRFAVLSLSYSLYQKDIVLDSSAIIIFIITSVVLVLIGYLPGETKEKWRMED
jgi:hypothetical protein